MQLDSDDLKELAYSVRKFLNKSDVLTRMSATPVLYLELPEIGLMQHLHKSILQALPPDVQFAHTNQFWSYPDDHTIKYEPWAGVTIVLSCKQRFAIKSGGSVGYRDIAFSPVRDLKK